MPYRFEDGDGPDSRRGDDTDDYDSLGAYSPKSRPKMSHGVTEALDENEILLKKVSQLEKQNRELMEQLEERELAASGPARQRLDSEPVRGRARLDSEVAEDQAARLEILEEASERLTREAEQKDEELFNLKERCQAAEGGSKQLEESLVELKKMLARTEAQHLNLKQAKAEESAKVKELSRTIEEMQHHQENQAFHGILAEDEEAPDQMADLVLNGEDEPRQVGNLANELFAYSRDDITGEGYEDETVEEPYIQKIAAPPGISGHMLKKSPSTWRSVASVVMTPFQERFFCLEIGKLSWWECLGKGPGHDHGKCKGSVDFGINLCILTVIQEGVKFSISPKDGVWVAGNFTNSAAGRVLEFSTTGSEHTFEEWCDNIRAHIDHGERRAAAVATAIAAAICTEEDDII